MAEESTKLIKEVQSYVNRMVSDFSTRATRRTEGAVAEFKSDTEVLQSKTVSSRVSLCCPSGAVQLVLECMCCAAISCYGVQQNWAVIETVGMSTTINSVLTDFCKCMLAFSYRNRNRNQTRLHLNQSRYV